MLAYHLGLDRKAKVRPYQYPLTRQGVSEVFVSESQPGIPQR